ncbi:phosphoethanolamine transferase CptA [Salmonella enterica]|nr:phosphoethanolamine transferase CptA [Salmonella enterica]
MQSTLLQTKPAFSWKALGWALLYFWFFSTLLQAIIYLTGYSGTNGLRDSLLYSSLWLIPVFLFPGRIRVIAAVIGVVLWAASLAALSYYVIYGQEFSQSVLFVMFETNANEASEYLSQYFSLKIVLVALAYTVAAILLWTRLRPVYIPSPWRYLVSFALLYGLILHPIAMNTFIKHKSMEKTLDSLASRMEPAAPWQFITGYYQYRLQLASLNKLLNENDALPPLANFQDHSGDAPRTLVLVIITNQQTMTARNTMLTVFSKQTDKQFYMNQQRTQSAREYDSNVLAPFKAVLADPAPKKFIIVHLLGTHIKYKFRYPENQGKFDGKTDHVPPGLSSDELESYNDYDNANLYNDYVVASLIKDYKATDPNGFLLYFSDHGEEVYDTPPHKTQGRNEDSPTRHMYTVPFLLWTSEKWQAAHPRDFSQDVDRKYSSSELIHTWSDLAGLTYDGYDPTRSITNPQFKETTRWIGNPYKKNALIDYDTLPYGDQVGNQ